MKLYVQEPCADIPENVIREALKVVLGNNPYLHTSLCIPSCDKAIELVCVLFVTCGQHLPNIICTRWCL